MISLRNRLSITYALFISISLFALTLVVNKSAASMFTRLAKDNIAARSAEITQAVGELYNPLTGEFDTAAVESIGMLFTHEGYIITVKDRADTIVWDARACDMQECNMVINTIAARMENDYRLSGGLRGETYPVLFAGKQVGSVGIETYGPFFYSETETRFLSSLNRLLIIAGVFFILISIALSLLLAAAIARPVRKASAAARNIAGGNLEARVDDNYKTSELHELSSSINSMASELAEAERRQKQLTADVAHELRTPLTCLQGNLEAMLDGVWAPTPERLASCHEETRRLTKLVENLSALANIEWHTITLNKTDFDLAALIAVVAAHFESAARENGIALALDCPPLPVNADYDRIKQVFFNIVSNAIKYTDEGSITISGRQFQDKTGLLRCEVAISDTGIGIPPEDLPYIFERFYRTDKSRNRATGGSGIGLTIAAAIVKRHGGAITAEAGEGSKGSVFRVAL